ncbi:hypothetical protein ABW21_db0205117 [Orbilia brochopaga]|nr:hypothetical protein ABW21_db0205117 [Drechslerella brochopaga]
MHPCNRSLAIFLINLRLLAWLTVTRNIPLSSAAAERTLPPSPTTIPGYRNNAHPQPVRLRLPETAKYRPQDVEELVRQHDDAVANGAPRPVMKLFADIDAGEKYYPHVDSYGIVVDLPGDTGLIHIPVNVHFTELDDEEEEDDDQGAMRLGRRAAGSRVKRQASCPSGNSPCTGIGKPGICCPGGTTYNQCPQGSGGGCCLPGYGCSPNGCIIGAGSQSTVTMNGPPVTLTSAPPTTTSTVTVAAIAGGLDLCQMGYYPCAASLGYDCPYYNGPGTPGSEYASSGFTIPASNGGVVVNPSTIVYPTEGFSTIGTLTLAALNSQNGPKITDAPGAVVAGNSGSCPAGFSSCGAEFNGGCCRLGRACGVSYCPVAVQVVDTVPTGVVTLTTTAGNGGGGDNGGCPASWIRMWDV